MITWYLMLEVFFTVVGMLTASMALYLGLKVIRSDYVKQLNKTYKMPKYMPEIKQTKIGEMNNMEITKTITNTVKTMDFGVALLCLKAGRRVARKGWNGKGIFIELQRPDEHSKMSHPYIYIDTTGLQTDNPDAPRNRVPWLASQTDMLAEDWVIVDELL